MSVTAVIIKVHCMQLYTLIFVYVYICIVKGAFHHYPLEQDLWFIKHADQLTIL
jgi:hypothetical protein